MDRRQLLLLLAAQAATLMGLQGQDFARLIPEAHFGRPAAPVLPETSPAADIPRSDIHVAADDSFFAGTDADELRPYLWLREFSPDAALGGRTPSGLWPQDMFTAYSIIPGGGAGVMVAIIDAYDSPALEQDLNTFSHAFGLPPCTMLNGCLTKVDQTGGARFNRVVSGWQMETNLDVEWVHAIAPAAKILLVEAHTASSTNLMAAVQYAVAHAQVVSMSWGGRESVNQVQFDATFMGVPGQNVAVFAAAGDVGGVVSYPASSINVIGVGGTNLAVDPFSGALAIPVVETAWSGSGGGCSRYEPALAAQASIIFPTPCTMRATPDVAAAGGPSSAASVFSSWASGWHAVYGTSLATPMWAGLAALADSARGAPLSSGQLLLALYAAPLLNYRDITSGQTNLFMAAPGYDFITGLGSPQANSLIPYLAGVR